MTENTGSTESPAAGARAAGRIAQGAQRCAQRQVAIVLVTALLLTACAPLETPTERDERVRNRAKLDAAVAMFEERCKSAGEKIYRTAENVDGILLMKLRPEKYSAYDQNAVDPYGHDTDGQKDGYIETFLMGRNDAGRLIGQINAPRIGYRHVDVVKPRDRNRYRYTAYLGLPPELEGKRTEPMFLVRAMPTQEAVPRYGVTYDDITTPEERAVWIAGSSLKVIDLQTKEVIAERVGYMIDKGQGNTGGGRQPWTHARQWACPAFEPRPGGPSTTYQTRNFVEKILTIKQGDKK